MLINSMSTQSDFLIKRTHDLKKGVMMWCKIPINTPVLNSCMFVILPCTRQSIQTCTWSRLSHVFSEIQDDF